MTKLYGMQAWCPVTKGNLIHWITFIPYIKTSDKLKCFKSYKIHIHILNRSVDLAQPN